MIKNEFNSIFISAESDIKNTFFKALFIITIILFLLLVFIIPFMFFTMIHPPKNVGTLDNLSFFSFVNIVYFIITTAIVFLIYKFSYIKKVDQFFSSIDNISNDEIKNHIIALNRKNRNYKTLFAFILHFSAWCGFIVAFMASTSSFAFSHKLYYFNLVPTIGFLIYLIVNFPSSGNLKKILLNKLD